MKSRMKFRRALVGLLDRVVGREAIGQPECPLMLRWTLWAPRRGEEPWFKVLVHYFPPNVSDRDPHDHPRSFFTFILRGRYFNTEWEDYGGEFTVPTIEMIDAGRIVYRPADHTHIVETGDAGCWTLVVMGPLKRPWGFVHLEDMSWWPWKRYVEEFGGVIRCDAEPDRMGLDL